MAHEPRGQAESVPSEISRVMVQLTREWTGRGPTKARTDIIDDLVIVRLEGVLLKAEHKLAHVGETEAVRDMRRRFQSAMREPMVAEVERILDRKVTAFLSDQHLDPDIAVEMFLLAPPDETEAAGDDSDPRA